jgi:uncharacterized protein YndB with AHSA1/START domain
MSFAFTVSATIPASPRAIYDAWLDGRRHGKMNGGGKATGSARIGGKFTAWDDYINGRNLELAPGKRIVQSWRTTQFTDQDPDSQIAVTLVKVAGGTKVTLRHSKVPDGHDGYKSGWKTHYFEPMKEYFAAAKKQK